MWNDYLLTKAQLSSHGTARLLINENSIFVELSGKGAQWRMSSVLFRWEGREPGFLRELLSSRGALHWSTKGSFLKLDSRSSALRLVQETPVLYTYLSFRKCLSEFVSVSEEWKQILRPIH